MKTYSYDCNIFFEEDMHGNQLYLFNISVSVNIVRSTIIYFHLIHHKPKLTLSLEEAISFINTITFSGLSTLVIPKFFNVTFF